MSLAAYILVGPTASGKSAVAHCLAMAGHPPHPIISADSMTIYTGMDIGTAKPDASERDGLTLAGFDLTTPDNPFSVGDYLKAIEAAAPALKAAGNLPIVTGGTGLYVKCLTEGLQSPAVDRPDYRQQAEDILETGGLAALQEAARRLNPEQYDRLRDPENPRRVVRAYEIWATGGRLPDTPAIRPRHKIAGLRLPTEELHSRIARRTRQMFAYGLIDEVRQLRAAYPVLSETARHAIGYAEAAAVLDGEYDEEEAIERTIIRTRQYAKRQYTWFRNQADVVWVDVHPMEAIERIAGRVKRIWDTYGPSPLQI